MVQPVDPGIRGSWDRRNQRQHRDLQAVQSCFAARFMYYARCEVDIAYELRANQCGDKETIILSYGLEIIRPLHEILHTGEGFDGHSLNRTLSYTKLMLAR